MADESLIAVFIDFENLAIGLRPGRFQADIVLKRFLERGRVVHKRAYCDWSGYRNDVRDMHTQGIELIDIPQTRHSGKNSADIRMVVDAIDLSYAKDHIDTFALITGDSDFSPLASKLKENNRRVIGCGVRKSTSDLLINSCDEFMFYDDLVEKSQQRPTRRKRVPAPVPEPEVKAEPKSKAKPKSRAKGKPAVKAPVVEPVVDSPQEEGIDRLVQIVASLEEDYSPLWSSLVKQSLRRVDPGFSEKRYGFRNFNEMMAAAAAAGYIELEHDKSRGNDMVRLREA
ncbi:MAG: NYN domain-containing protein [Gemmatimonadetes bacterium]|nr:NYN domain-containing protein [Gemmatimonadota bacterium]MBT6144215.1 NYN domain-containing protein [Gemmatimonadota bacterium]MBT7863959.1 NYN domain-containing protein [Gemmatimonadota bacterium]